VVIGGTTFTFGPGATPTTDLVNGQTIVIGPSGVGFKMTTFTGIGTGPSPTQTGKKKNGAAGLPRLDWASTPSRGIIPSAHNSVSPAVAALEMVVDGCEQWGMRGARLFFSPGVMPHLKAYLNSSLLSFPHSSNLQLNLFHISPPPLIKTSQLNSSSFTSTNPLFYTSADHTLVQASAPAPPHPISAQPSTQRNGADHHAHLRPIRPSGRCVHTL
jgi:hypothetical protein